MKEHPGLRKSTQILNNSVTKFKARNNLFPVNAHPTPLSHPPPSFETLRVRRGMEVHSVNAKDKIWKGREEGRNKQVPEQSN